MRKGFIPVIIVIAATVALTASILIGSIVSTSQSKKISSSTRADWCGNNGGTDYGRCQSFQKYGDCAQGAGQKWFFCGQDNYYHGPCDTEAECKSGSSETSTTQQKQTTTNQQTQTVDKNITCFNGWLSCNGQCPDESAQSNFLGVFKTKQSALYNWLLEAEKAYNLPAGTCSSKASTQASTQGTAQTQATSGSTTPTGFYPDTFWDKAYDTGNCGKTNNFAKCICGALGSNICTNVGGTEPGTSRICTATKWGSDWGCWVVPLPTSTPTPTPKPIVRQPAVRVPSTTSQAGSGVASNPLTAIGSLFNNCEYSSFKECYDGCQNKSDCKQIKSACFQCSKNNTSVQPNVTIGSIITISATDSPCKSVGQYVLDSSNNCSKCISTTQLQIKALSECPQTVQNQVSVNEQNIFKNIFGGDDCRCTWNQNSKQFLWVGSTCEGLQRGRSCSTKKSCIPENQTCPSAGDGSCCSGICTANSTGSGFTCKSATTFASIVNQLCTPGLTKCEGNVLKKCGIGAWTNQETCTKGCQTINPYTAMCTETIETANQNEQNYTQKVYQSEIDKTKRECDRKCEETMTGTCVVTGPNEYQCVPDSVTKPSNQTIVDKVASSNIPIISDLSKVVAKVTCGQENHMCCHSSLPTMKLDYRAQLVQDETNINENAVGHCDTGLVCASSDLCIADRIYQVTQATLYAINNSCENTKTCKAQSTKITVDKVQSIIATNLLNAPNPEQNQKSIDTIQKLSANACGDCDGSCVYSDFQSQFICVSKDEIMSQYHKDDAIYQTGVGNKGELGQECWARLSLDQKNYNFCNKEELECGADNRCHIKITADSAKQIALRVISQESTVLTDQGQALNQQFFSSQESQGLAFNRDISKVGCTTSNTFYTYNGSCWMCIDAETQTVQNIGDPSVCKNADAFAAVIPGNTCKKGNGYCATKTVGYGLDYKQNICIQSSTAVNDCPNDMFCCDDIATINAEQSKLQNLIADAQSAGLNQPCNTNSVTGIQKFCIQGLECYNNICQDKITLSYNSEYQKAGGSGIPLIGGFFQALHPQYYEGMDLRANVAIAMRNNIASAAQQDQNLQKIVDANPSIGGTFINSLDGRAKSKAYVFIQDNNNLNISNDPTNVIARGTFIAGTNLSNLFGAIGQAGEAGNLDSQNTFFNYAQKSSEINTQIARGEIAAPTNIFDNPYAGAANEVGWEAGSAVAQIALLGGLPAQFGARALQNGATKLAAQGAVEAGFGGTVKQVAAGGLRVLAAPLDVVGGTAVKKMGQGLTSVGLKKIVPGTIRVLSLGRVQSQGAQAIANRLVLGGELTFNAVQSVQALETGDWKNAILNTYFTAAPHINVLGKGAAKSFNMQSEGSIAADAARSVLSKKASWDGQTPDAIKTAITQEAVRLAALQGKRYTFGNIDTVINTELARVNPNANGLGASSADVINLAKRNGVDIAIPEKVNQFVDGYSKVIADAQTKPVSIAQAREILKASGLLDVTVQNKILSNLLIDKVIIKSVVPISDTSLQTITDSQLEIQRLTNRLEVAKTEYAAKSTGVFGKNSIEARVANGEVIKLESQLKIANEGYNLLVTDARKSLGKTYNPLGNNFGGRGTKALDSYLASIEKQPTTNTTAVDPLAKAQPIKFVIDLKVPKNVEDVNQVLIDAGIEAFTQNGRVYIRGTLVRGDLQAKLADVTIDGSPVKPGQSFDLQSAHTLKKGNVEIAFEVQSDGKININKFIGGNQVPIAVKPIPVVDKALQSQQKTINPVVKKLPISDETLKTINDSQTKVQQLTKDLAAAKEELNNANTAGFKRGATDILNAKENLSTLQTELDAANANYKTAVDTARSSLGRTFNPFGNNFGGRGVKALDAYLASIEKPTTLPVVEPIVQVVEPQAIKPPVEPAMPAINPDAEPLVIDPKLQAKIDSNMSRLKTTEQLTSEITKANSKVQQLTAELDTSAKKLKAIGENLKTTPPSEYQAEQAKFNLLESQLESVQHAYDTAVTAARSSIDPWYNPGGNNFLNSRSRALDATLRSIENEIVPAQQATRPQVIQRQSFNFLDKALGTPTRIEKTVVRDLLTNNSIATLPEIEIALRRAGYAADSLTQAADSIRTQLRMQVAIPAREQITQAKVALNAGDAANQDLVDYWRQIVRDQNGDLQAYVGKVTDSYYKGIQSRPDLNNPKIVEYINANLQARENFLNGWVQGRFNGSTANFQLWLVEMHKLQAYKGQGGVIRSGSAFSPGSHTPFVNEDILPIAQRLGDPYAAMANKTNGNAYTLQLPGISPDGLATDTWINNGKNIYHNYPNARYFPEYEAMMQLKLHELADLRSNAPRQVTVTKIAEFYQYSINSRMFSDVNNSLFMNIANSLLQDQGLRGVQHGVLDFAAMRLSPKGFAEYFIEQVKKVNPRY